MRLRLVALLTLLWPAPALAENADLIIRNGLVVTMDGAARLIEDGVVVVTGPDIAAVGGPELLETYTAPKVIDAAGGIVMPGMVNLHTHNSMVAFRGLGEYAVENILFDVMFPLEKALLDRELIRVAARQAAIELALAGVTTFADMYYHEDEVARATKEVGLRGVLGETVIGFPVVDAPEPYGGLAYAEGFIKAFKDDPLITPAVAPHAAYTVDKAPLLAAKALAEKYDVPILMHLVEFAGEREMAQARHPDMGAEESVIRYLDRIGFLGPRLTAAHVIYLDQADMDILAARGVGIAHNPGSNAKGGMGISPAWEMYTQGLAIGLGTDGPMSANRLEVMLAMSAAAGHARQRLADAKPFTPHELVDMATLGGARALHMADRIGSLEPGKRADLIIIDTSAPNMQPLYDVYAAIAFQAYPADVRTTIVHGAPVVEDRRIVQADMAAHAVEWKRVTDRVREFWFSERPN